MPVLARETVTRGDRIAFDSGWLFSRWTWGTVIAVGNDHVSVKADSPSGGSASTHYLPYEVTVQRPSGRRFRLGHPDDVGGRG